MDILLNGRAVADVQLIPGYSGSSFLLLGLLSTCNVRRLKGYADGRVSPSHIDVGGNIGIPTYRGMDNIMAWPD